jgi:hypothetical protein
MKKGYVLILVLILLIPALGNSQNNISPKSVNKNELLISVESRDASNAQTNDAYIKLKVSGGAAPYKTSFFSPYAFPSHTSGDKLLWENIKAGDYLIVIQDSLGNTIYKEIKIK